MLSTKQCPRHHFLLKLNTAGAMFSKIKADPRLLRIEQAGGLDGGLGPLLQKSLSNYDDSMLRSELGGASEEILNAGGIHENIFVDISQSASAGYISEGEARRLFRQGLAIETRLGASADAVSAPPALFDILLNILFKKLQILHLTRDICSHRLMVASSTKSLDFYRTRSIEEVQKNKTSKRGTSKQQLRSTTPLSDLRNQLKNSSIIQQKLDKKIASNLTLLSQTVSLADHTSAAAFSKQVGTRKVEVLLHKKLNKYYTLFFGKWKSTLKSMNAEIFSIRFLRLLGATKLWEYAWGQATKKKLRYIRKWYLITMSINRADAERSAVIMQSVIRGGLGRERVRQIRRNRAAVTIQKRHRGYLGRLRMMDRRAHLCLCAAVAVVERAYQRHIWVRAGNRMRLMLRRDKACRKIQCAQRAHRASVFIIRIRRARLERANALKIQSQWRRYLASMRVDNIRRRRLWLDATLLLQRVARGMLDRLFVMDRREMIQAAVLIQCAWRSSVARFVVQERRKKFNATIIQKTIRGLWGRKRFRQIYNVQRDALAQIARGVRGYIDRKKYKPIIAAFTARRSVASAILAIRLKALHTGMKDRRKVKRMMASVIRMQMFIRRVLFNKRASLRETRRKNMAAKEIQRIARGYNDRRLVLKLREEKDRLDKLKDRNKIPLYYRVYQNYLRDQFLLHRPMILILQCFFRVTRARRRVNFLRQTAAVKKIQRTCRRHLQTKHAREALRKKRLAKLYRNECAIHINKVVRGFLGRRYINKIHMANTIKWFFEQMRSKGLASRVFDSFRYCIRCILK